MANKFHTFYGIPGFFIHCSQTPATTHPEPD